MSTLKDAIFTRASAFAGLTNLIGSPPRFYPVKLPDAPVYPCATYNIVSGLSYSAMGVDTTVARRRLQITVWGGLSYADMDAVCEQVRACFKRLKATISSVVILDIYKLNETDLYDADAKVYYRAMDFDVAYYET